MSSIRGLRKMLLPMIGAALFVLPIALPTQLFAQFAGVELRIPDETVPPGGMLQLKVEITEPRPISKGGQKARFQSQALAPIQGIALFSPNGDASGTAVLSQGAAQFSLQSPAFDMGKNTDYPIITIAMPVKPTAARGTTADLVLDPSISQWLDPSAHDYPVLITNGQLTIGGSLSLANIVPGGGVVPPGTKIAISGMGFRPDTKIQISDAKIASQTFVSANEIDITLRAGTNMTAARVRVENPSTNEKITYFSYQRISQMGKSKHALIAATVPLFSEATWTTAYFRPTLTGSQFSAIALQNPTGQTVKATLRLSASNGTLLKMRMVQLKANRRWSRDLVEFFTGVVPGDGTSLKVTTSAPIPMLGLLGDDASGTVDPVNPSPTP